MAELQTGNAGILASFDHLDATVDAIHGLREAGFKDVTTYSPYPEHELEDALGYGPSIVRVFTLAGGMTGAAAGFAFTIFTSQDWPMVTGGKPLLSIPAYFVIAFEMAILFGALSTLIGLFISMRLPNLRPLVVYDPEFSSGRYGIFVPAANGRSDEARKILEEQHPAELREDEGAAHD
jgi:hypothetical protein